MRLTCDLSKDRPLDEPWVVRSSTIARKSGSINDTLSVASSYLRTSVLSSKSKRMHIDNIISEHEQVMDRVKKIDDQLRREGADDEKSAKAELLQRVVQPRSSTPPLEVIKEAKDEGVPEKFKIKPTVTKEEAKNQNLTLKDTSAEIDVLQKLLNSPEMMNEVIKLSQMMFDSKIDFRVLEFLKRGINKEYEEATAFITVAAFHKYWRNLIRPEVGQLDPAIEDKVLHFVTTKDGEKVDKNKLFTLIDFYQYYPVYVQKDRNQSKEMYYVLSSNTDGGYNWSQGLKKKDLETLDKSKDFIYLLEYINDKIKEKHPKMAQAYRFFDVDHKSAISKEEFAVGLQKLKIVMEQSEIDKVFDYLDRNKNGKLTYNEF